MKTITRTALLIDTRVKVDSISKETLEIFQLGPWPKNSINFFPIGFYRLLDKTTYVSLKEVQILDKNLTELEKKFDGDVSLLVAYIKLKSMVQQDVPVKFHGDGLLKDCFVNEIIDEFYDRYYGVFSSTKACKEKIAIQDAKAKKPRNDASSLYSGGYRRGLTHLTHRNESHYFVVYLKNFDD